MKPIRIPHATLAAAVAAAIPGAASAASFYLIESSASHMGNSFAGTASSADDASTVYFNSAGMTQLEKPSLQAGGHLVMPEASFDNDGSTTAVSTPLQGSDGKTNESAVVPNLYYVHPMNDTVTFGIGVNAPFGLESSYDDEWVGRYHATDSAMKTVNINPSFAFQVTDRLSIGYGFNFQYIDASLENEVDSFSACSAAVGGPTCINSGAFGSGAATSSGIRAFDSSVEVSGDDRGTGLDIGMLYEFDEDTRVGLSWREGIDYTLEGTVDYDRSDACDASACSGVLVDGPVTTDIELPDIVTLSATHGIGQDWTVNADVAWYGWDSIQRIRVERPNGQAVDTLDLEYDDTMRYALGATYSGLDSTTLRGGVAFDESPVSSPETATARIPDQDRTWVSVGATFALSDSSSVDVGYAHLIVDDARINNTNRQDHTLTGEFDPAVDILSVAGNWRF